MPFYTSGPPFPHVVKTYVVGWRLGEGLGPMGPALGVEVGAALGLPLGAAWGLDEGRGVGLLEGRELGASVRGVGSALGQEVRKRLGASVAFLVGLCEGRGDGKPDGTALGVEVGAVGPRLDNDAVVEGDAVGSRLLETLLGMDAAAASGPLKAGPQENRISSKHTGQGDPLERRRAPVRLSYHRPRRGFLTRVLGTREERWCTYLVSFMWSLSEAALPRAGPVTAAGHPMLAIARS